MRLFSWFCPRLVYVQSSKILITIFSLNISPFFFEGCGFDFYFYLWRIPKLPLSIFLKIWSTIQTSCVQAFRRLEYPWARSNCNYPWGGKKGSKPDLIKLWCSIKTSCFKAHWRFKPSWTRACHYSSKSQFHKTSTYQLKQLWSTKAKTTSSFKAHWRFKPSWTRACSFSS